MTSVTEFRVVEKFENRAGIFSLVEARPLTGRTHQIRVHLAHIGHPLLGDPVYSGRRRASLVFPRQALHAIRLGLTHPGSGEAMDWEIPMEPDLAALLALFRAEAGTDVGS
jgi:23S rRNA pseudouridine1911/1915/1917 synthase